MNDEVKPLTPKERDAARGQNMFAPLGDAEYLNSVSTVDRVLREYLSGLTDIRARYHRDEIDGPAATQAVADRAKQYADIFMGRSKDYSTTEWNTPDRLGSYLQQILAEESTPEDATEKFLTWLAAQFITTVIIPAEDETASEEALQFRVEVLVEDAAHALLGLPNSADE